MRNKRGVLLVLSLSLTAFSFAMFTACGGKSQKNTDDPKFTQYFRQGRQLYTLHCSNCHQPDGSGLARVYPPLDTSDYVDDNPDAVICIIRHGETKPLTVNGVEFVQPMPGIPTLTDLEIAEIVTYIYNSWDRDRGLIEVASVTETLNKCSP